MRQAATKAAQGSGIHTVKKHLGVLTCPTLDTISPTKSVSLVLAIIEPHSEYLPLEKSP